MSVAVLLLGAAVATPLLDDVGTTASGDALRAENDDLSGGVGADVVIVNEHPIGYLDEMQRRYGLVMCHSDARAALKTLQSWLFTPPDSGQCLRAKDALVKEHIDVTSYVIDEIDRL